MRSPTSIGATRLRSGPLRGVWVHSVLVYWQVTQFQERPNARTMAKGSAGMYHPSLTQTLPIRSLANFTTRRRNNHRHPHELKQRRNAHQRRLKNPNTREHLTVFGTMLEHCAVAS